MTQNLGCVLPLIMMYALNNITNTGIHCNELIYFYYQHNTHKIDWPDSKMCVTMWKRFFVFLQRIPYMSIATDDDSISMFNTVVANIAAQCVQDNAIMSKLYEIN